MTTTQSPVQDAVLSSSAAQSHQPDDTGVRIGRDKDVELRESGLTINRARKTFRSAEGKLVHAIDDVSLNIEAGEFFVLLGPSGCGKTTLLRSIGGLETLDAGEIYLGDQRIDEMPPYERPVNTVFQSYALFPNMTVEQNIAFGLEMEKKPKDYIKRKTQEMLDLVHLSEIGKRLPSQLSGGQQQRVALARSLAKSPKVLLLDESLSALDFKLRRQMQIELKRLQRETGIIFIFVTHDQEEALSMADHIAVFSKGKPEQVGTPEEIYDKPANRFVADFIGDINFLDATVHDAGSVEVEGKIFPVTQDLSEYGRGATVSAAVRPERITLGAAKDGGLQASVETVTYMGSDIRCHVRLADGTPVQIRVNPPFDSELLTVGAKVGVTVSPDHMRVVER